MYTYNVIENRCPPCNREMPGAQYPDPSPLPAVESGYVQPYHATKTMPAQCQSPSENLSSVALDSTHTARGAGISSIYQLDGGSAIVRYILIPEYYTGASPTTYTNMKIYGSANGTDWTLIATLPAAVQTNIDRKYFLPATTAYEYYKVEVTAMNPAVGVADPIVSELAFYPQADQIVYATASASSTVNQLDADQKAENAAIIAAQALLNCPTVYSVSVDYTARCTTGFGADVTRTATVISLNSRDEAEQAASAQAKADAEADLVCTMSNNTQKLIINRQGSGADTVATPYPSVHFITGGPASIAAGSRPFLKLNNFSHPLPSDIAILLVSPAGTKMVAMVGCGNIYHPTPFSIELGDGNPSLPSATLIQDDSSYRPKIYGAYAGLWPSPAPDTTGGNTPAATPLFSIFYGENANGAWKLYVLNQGAGLGSIDSWEMRFLGY